MAEQAYAYVTLIPVAKGFKNSIEKELGGIDGVGGAIGAQTGGRFASGFGGALKTLAVTAGAALASVGIGRFFSESIKQSSDLGESVNAVNKAYGDFAGDVLKLGGDVANRLGLATVDFNAAAVRFSSFAGRIAGEGGNVASVVDSLTTRAADFASVYNIDVQEALQVFQSGLSGEAEPLKRFGINLLDSEVKAYAYANGIATAGRELTETEKVQARYGLLLQETAKTAGDFADTSDGLANSQRILAANVKNLQAEVGAGLTPVMATFTSALVPLAQVIFPAIADFLNTYIAPGLQKAADAFKAFAVEVKEGGGGVGAIFDTIKNNLMEFFEGDGMAQFFERISEMRTQFFEAIQRALPGIIDGFVKFYPIFLQTAIQFFTLLIDALVQIIPPLVDTLVKVLPKLIDAMLTLIPIFIDGAVTLFTAIIKAIDLILPPLIKAVVELIPMIVKALISALPLLVDGAIKLFTGILQGITAFLPDLIKAVLVIVPTIVKTLLENLPLLIKAGIDLLAGLAKGIIENAPQILAAAVGAIGETLVDGVKDFLGIRSPSRVFQTIGENVGDGLVNGIKNSKSKVSAAAKELSKASIPPGFEWVVGPNGPYLERSAVVSGRDMGELNPQQEASMATMAITANLRAQGFTGSQIDKVFEAALGGSAAEVAATFSRGVELINTATNQRIMGNIQGAELAKLQSQGFVLTEKVNASQEELTKAIQDLTQTVQSGGAKSLLMAEGGLVTGPTRAIVGEAGPEVVIPLDRFESMMDLGSGKTVNYYAAPNQSIDAEQSLFQAMRRAKVVANW